MALPIPPAPIPPAPIPKSAQRRRRRAARGLPRRHPGPGRGTTTGAARTPTQPRRGPASSNHTRSSGGHRRYSRRQLELAARIRALFDEGITLDSAARIVGLRDELDTAHAVNGALDPVSARRRHTPASTNSEPPGATPKRVRHRPPGTRPKANRRVRHGTRCNALGAPHMTRWFSRSSEVVAGIPSRCRVHGRRRAAVNARSSSSR
ncbi:MerR family transcriptional regulator [Actinomycetes bacterium KLBMP 9759]